MVRKIRDWWKTPNSTLQVAKYIKWAIGIFWVLAEPLGYIVSIRILNHISYAAFFFSIWSLERTAAVEVKEEEIDKND